MAYLPHPREENCLFSAAGREIANVVISQEKDSSILSYDGIILKWLPQTPDAEFYHRGQQKWVPSNPQSVSGLYFHPKNLELAKIILKYFGDCLERKGIIRFVNSNVYQLIEIRHDFLYKKNIQYYFDNFGALSHHAFNADLAIFRAYFGHPVLLSSIIHSNTAKQVSPLKCLKLSFSDIDCHVDDGYFQELPHYNITKYTTTLPKICYLKKLLEIDPEKIFIFFTDQSDVEQVFFSLLHNFSSAGNFENDLPVLERVLIIREWDKALISTDKFLNKIYHFLRRNYQPQETKIFIHHNIEVNYQNGDSYCKLLQQNQFSGINFSTTGNIPIKINRISIV